VFRYFSLLFPRAKSTWIWDNKQETVGFVFPRPSLGNSKGRVKQNSLFPEGRSFKMQWPDHVRAKSSSCCFPGEWPMTRDTFSSNRKTYELGCKKKLMVYYLAFNLFSIEFLRSWFQTREEKMITLHSHTLVSHHISVDAIILLTSCFACSLNHTLVFPITWNPQMCSKS